MMISSFLVILISLIIFIMWATSTTHYDFFDHRHLPWLGMCKLLKKWKIWSKDKWSGKSDDIFLWLFHQKSNLIQFDLFWSILIHFDPFWTDLIKSDQKINKIRNLMIYFNDYLILIKFDPYWSLLDRSDSIWSKNK